GFKIWNTGAKESFEHISGRLVHDEKEIILALKSQGIWTIQNLSMIGYAIDCPNQIQLQIIIGVGSDFQNQRLVRIERPNMKVPADNHNWQITKDNLLQSSSLFFCTSRH
ncbi:MAG: hypothetical protein IPH40_12685, partial [Polaromonas sp.]|nr:hypothetical protein [Polaromonas sp.]